MVCGAIRGDGTSTLGLIGVLDWVGLLGYLHLIGHGLDWSNEPDI